MTPEEPITGRISSEHCYLRTSEFTNNPRINSFVTGVVTHNDSYSNIGVTEDPLIKVFNLNLNVRYRDRLVSKNASQKLEHIIHVRKN